VEVIGGCVFPTRVNRRKARLVGKLVHSSEALFSSVPNLVVARGYVIASIVLTQGSPMGPGTFKTCRKPKERKNQWP
jgi:hypothetical protein